MHQTWQTQSDRKLTISLNSKHRLQKVYFESSKVKVFTVILRGFTMSLLPWKVYCECVDFIWSCPIPCFQTTIFFFIKRRVIVFKVISYHQTIVYVTENWFNTFFQKWLTIFAKIANFLYILEITILFRVWSKHPLCMGIH